MTLGWYELQEASRGSDLGKEKQEAHHTQGSPLKMDTTPSLSQGPWACMFFSPLFSKMSQPGWSNRATIFSASLRCQVLCTPIAESRYDPPYFVDGETEAQREALGTVSRATK